MKKLFLIYCVLFALVGNCFAQVPTQQPYPALSSAGNITQAEVFVGNTDPGIGAATPLPVPTPGADITIPNTTINFAALPDGIQFVYVRTKDANGNWSLTNYKLFIVGGFAYAAPTSAGNITQAEVFVGNTDPGTGNATPLPVATVAADITIPSTTVNFAALPDGIQFVYVRSKDVSGKWSLTNYKLFIVGGFGYPALAATSNITQAEVFVGNTDPGIGNATPLPVATPGLDITIPNTTVNFAAQPDGVNFVYVRSKDVSGKWSLTNFKLFTVGGFGYPASPSAAGNIVQAEYFTGNTDPGIGNANPLPIPTGTDVTTGNVNITIPALANGNQDLFVRTLDANGKWSLTNFKQYTVGIFGYPLVAAAAPSIANLEYYVDADPGFGNGTPITFAATTDVQLNNIPITISGLLTNGAHVFHIRSKQNPWSIDNAKPFNVGGVVPITWSYITAILQNAQTLVSWATEQEINTSKFEIERSIDGLKFEKIGEQLAAGNSTSIKKYEYKDVQPAIGFNFYRIKQIDVDGRFTYSTIVKVLNTKNIKEAFIAPNPVIDMVNLVEPEAIYINSIEVYDSRGVVILRKNINNKVQLYSLPVSTLSKGNYVLKVNYEKGMKSIGFIK
jgi:Secretion system C-terminal sorting domain